MRTKRFSRHLIVGAYLLLSSHLFGQVSTGFNNGTSTDFVGWDASMVNDPLEIRHDANQPIEFSTNGNQRMQLWHGISNTINGYPSIFQDGFLGLSSNSNFFSGAIPGAFSRLHLVDAFTAGGGSGIYAQELGYRPWMRNGVTFTGNSDQGYLGQKFLLDEDSVVVNDRTDMVLQWSNDRASEAGPDRLRFIFTTTPNGDPSGTQSYEGLEVMRMLPVTDSTANVGVGDFFAGNLDDPINITEPTERLDVLNGRVRFRQLPNDAETDSAYKVMVVDDSNDPLERGVVKWKDLSSLVSCDWVIQTPQPHVSTAYPGSTCPPEMKHGVGIGYQYPKTKLDVYHTDNTYLEPIAIRGDARFVYGSGEEVIGVYGQASTPVTETAIASMHSIGVQGLAYRGKWTTGVNGEASCAGAGEGSAARVVGVSGTALANENADICIGVYGAAAGASAGEDWAGYFDGNVNATGAGFYVNGVFVASDESLKTNVEPLASALEIVGQLMPKQYEFIQELHPAVSFPAGQQAGFLAPELEEVLPALVRNTSIAAVVDSMGNVLHEALDYKAVNYAGVVPYLVGAIQELSAQYSTMAVQLAHMQEQLAACCTHPDDEMIRGVEPTGTNLLELEDDRNLRIQPNPFSESTTIYYMLDRAGRTQLLANSADGKQLKVLQEANLAQGSYQYEWNTTDLAPGMYYVTLLLDGEPVVRKAVKVTR